MTEYREAPHGVLYEVACAVAVLCLFGAAGALVAVLGL